MTFTKYVKYEKGTLTTAWRIFYNEDKKETAFMLTERVRISGYALSCCMGEKIRAILPVETCRKKV